MYTVQDEEATNLISRIHYGTVGLVLQDTGNIAKRKRLISKPNIKGTFLILLNVQNSKT